MTISAIDLFNDTEVKRLIAMCDNDFLSTWPHNQNLPMTWLNNTEWKKAYDTKYVSQYSDLYLMVDMVAVYTETLSNLTAGKPVGNGSSSLPSPFPHPPSVLTLAYQ